MLVYIVKWLKAGSWPLTHKSEGPRYLKTGELSKKLSKYKNLQRLGQPLEEATLHLPHY